MRVFKRPAFFILLIKKTLSGIGPFMILLAIIIVLVSNLLYVLNNHPNVMNSFDPNGMKSLDKTTLYSEDSSGNSFWNSVIHIYLISLGDFDDRGNYENRTETQRLLVWFLFLLGTFIIQLTFMNMLIAIMSDIFNQVMETKE